MIIDRTRLTGDAAYLRDQGTIDLSLAAAHVGRSAPIGEGLGLEVAGLHLLLQADDMHKLYARSPGDGKPLLSVSLRKEMFPEFFADPYGNRVHSIGGFEDFQRGTPRGLRAMEVEGRATLVSFGWGICGWDSPVYRLPLEVPLTAATWELASARLAPDEGFGYKLELKVWTAGQDPATDSPTTVPIAPATGGGSALAKPSALRNHTGLNLSGVIAYQLVFGARVHKDTDMAERLFGAEGEAPVGRPLLRAFHLLEPVSSAFSFPSLHELEMRCSEAHFLEPALPLRTLSAYLDLPALLVHREEISLTVRDGAFSLAEARLDAEVRVRPPVLDKALGHG